MKLCTRCGVNKELDRFQKRKASKDGLTASCKDCLSLYDKSRAKIPYRVKAREEYQKTDSYKKSHAKSIKKYRLNNPDKYRANSIISNAIRKGELIKQDYCSICGAKDVKIHGHHHDYSKPLDVVWCCATCHSKIHGRCK